jgi:hypothetical protein
MSADPTLFVPSPDLSEHAVTRWDRMVKQPNPVFMRRIGEPFIVETHEGRLTGQAGDYLAHDPISGHFWPVAASYVRFHYTWADPVDTVLDRGTA